MGFPVNLESATGFWQRGQLASTLKVLLPVRQGRLFDRMLSLLLKVIYFYCDATGKRTTFQ
jgi:hypothetical protein